MPKSHCLCYTQSFAEDKIDLIYFQFYSVSNQAYTGGQTREGTIFILVNVGC